MKEIIKLIIIAQILHFKSDRPILQGTDHNHQMQKLPCFLRQFLH